MTVAGIRPAVRLIAVGGLVVDDCCAGQLIVAWERVYRTPLGLFPAEAGIDDVCAGGLIAIEMVVRTDRCVPLINDRGQAPPIAEQEAAFAAVSIDAAVVWQAVTSLAMLGDDGYGFPDWQRAGVSQTPAGPDGGCLGVETRFTLGLSAVDWCLT